MSTLETSHDHPESPLYNRCQCKPVNGRRLATLDIRDGSIHTLLCVSCELDLGIEPDSLNSTDLVVSVREIVERVGMDLSGDYPDGMNVWFELSSPAEAGDVEEFAALAERLTAVNPSPAVLDALLAETAGGAA